MHQVEYAIEAINNAGTCIGILAKDGIVMASERRITSGLLAPAKVCLVIALECCCMVLSRVGFNLTYLLHVFYDFLRLLKRRTNCAIMRLAMSLV